MCDAQPMTVNLVFPGNFLLPRTPDEHFAPEHTAAAAASFSTCLLDDSQLPQASAIRNPSKLTGSLAYRGWMLTSEQYQGFDTAAQRHAMTLHVSPAQYESAHHLPGWYEHFADLTPVSRWTEGRDVEAAVAMVKEVGTKAAVVKDYVKSVKHLWHEACFIPDSTDTQNARAVIERLVHERDDSFQGGIVVRAYEPLSGAEVRTWWRDCECVLTSAHPDTPDQVSTHVPVNHAQTAVSALGHPLITVDWAQRTDGTWRVIEVGDAQVSDRPGTTAPDVLIRALFA